MGIETNTFAAGQFAKNLYNLGVLQQSVFDNQNFSSFLVLKDG